MTRADAYNPDWHAPADSEWIMPCMRIATVWMLTEFSYENGATVGRHPCDAASGCFDPAPLRVAASCGRVLALSAFVKFREIAPVF